MLLSRLGFLSGLFCIDVLAFSMMGTHLHTAVRSRPDDGRAWSATEVVRRWLLLHPFRNRRGLRDAKPGEVEALIADARFVERTRRKLMDLSQFMKELKQSIAVEINRLDGGRGPLWAGRFQSHPITEAERGQLVRTMIYIDLNPLAAGLCALPEDGLHTSLSARLGRDVVPAGSSGGSTRPATSTWLSPFAVEVNGDADAASGMGSAFGPHPATPETRACPDQPVRPVVMQGLTLGRYLRLLDHFARRLRTGKSSLDALAASIFERLKLPPCPGLACRGAPAG